MAITGDKEIMESHVRLRQITLFDLVLVTQRTVSVGGRHFTDHDECPVLLSFPTERAVCRWQIGTHLFNNLQLLVEIVFTADRWQIAATSTFHLPSRHLGVSLLWPFTHLDQPGKECWYFSTCNHNFDLIIVMQLNLKFPDSCQKRTSSTLSPSKLESRSKSGKHQRTKMTWNPSFRDQLITCLTSTGCTKRLRIPAAK